MNIQTYHSMINIQSVALNVWDLEAQTAFYETMLGLQVIQKGDREVQLGVDGQVLLVLHKVDSAVKREEAGLYHVAFLLPSREALGAMLRHLLAKRAPLEGVSDHVYSEAIYLSDVEGNGIEIYADRPMEEWERDAQGRPVGRTLPMDSQGVLADGAEVDISHYTMPVGSMVGHVHLSVVDVAKTTALYQDLFPLADKMTLPVVSFIAGGEYHHHFAFNNWSAVKAPKTANEMGLRHINVTVGAVDAYTRLANAEGPDVQVVDHEDYLSVTDTTNGIVVHVYLSFAA